MWSKDGFLIICLLCFSFYTLGVASKIEVSQQYHAINTSHAVHIECITGKDEAGFCGATPDHKNYVLIQAYRNTDTILASVQRDNIVQKNTMIKGVEANGEIASSQGDESFLKVTLNNVLKEDSGTYVCVFHYISGTGKLQQESSNVDVSIREPDLNDVVRDLKATLSLAEKRFTDLEARMSQIVANQVAFSVGLTQDLTVDANERIVYDKVIANVGGGYDVADGIFTCPVAGTYVFQWHLFSQKGEVTWLNLYHNAKYVASAYARMDDLWGTAGNAVVLQLAKNDRVYMKSRGISPIYGRTDSDHLYSTFSGYLISNLYAESQ